MRKIFTMMAAFLTLLTALTAFTGCSGKTVIDLKECVSVKFEGYNGEGRANVEIDDNYILSLLGDMNLMSAASVINSFQPEPIDNNGALSNGDVVTVKVKTDNSVLKNAKVSAANTELKFTVDGLKDKEKADIFKDVSLSVKGTSPQCSVAVSYNGTACSAYDFQMKTADGKEVSGYNYKNGDKVIVSLTDSAVKSLRKKYIFEETSREYTVKAEKAYILSAADLSETEAAAFKKVADDYVDKKMKDMDTSSMSSIVVGVSEKGAGVVAATSHGIKGIENIEFNSAYVGIEHSKGAFGQDIYTKYAYFFYDADITYTFSRKETSVNGATLIVRVKEPVISSSGDFSASSTQLSARKDLQTALNDMLKGDFDKLL